MTAVTPKSDGELFQRADAISHEGQGYVRFTVCIPSDFLGIADRAKTDRDASLIFEAWTKFRRTLTDLPRGERRVCSLCTRSLKPRQFSFGLLIPYGIDSPTEGMLFGMCEKCAPDRAEAEAGAIRAVARVFPNTRPLGILPSAGHA